MSIISIIGSCELTLGVIPSILLIDTNDTLATVKSTGYLNGQSILPCGFLTTPMPPLTTGQVALVTTSDQTTPVWLVVSVDGSSNINLISQAVG